ncbi:MAG: large conductance mechanosensitive channel protein MscL [Lachnospiraceae bacterium]|nr:large conductance mechanosensitive channel protein MscL [Lachnospiraceae bacterium]
MIEEFKKFIMRGNVLDLAVGVIIGGAFTAIVNSLVEDMISPLLGLFGTANLADMSVTLKEGVTLTYGNFITAIINFLLVAFVLFLIIKAINKAQDTMKKDEPEEAPTTKMCPYCKSEIAIDATKCPCCTSDL